MQLLKPRLAAYIERLHTLPEHHQELVYNLINKLHGYNTQTRTAVLWTDKTQPLSYYLSVSNTINSLRISQLSISKRLQNLLSHNGYTTVADVLSKTPCTLWVTPKMGPLLREELVQSIRELQENELL